MTSLMEKVDVRGPDECWPWLGYVHPRGHGHHGWTVGVTRQAHRLVYELLVGPIPPGLHLDHTCHKPAECAGGVTCPHRRCVNPAHLEPVTPRENMLRSLPNHMAGRLAARTHCPQGHPYDVANTRRRPDGGRACRACEAARSVRRRAS